MNFRPAELGDCETAAQLINLAYRGEKVGWTTESHLLGGLRTDEAMLRDLISRPGSTLLLASTGELVGCVHLEKRAKNKCYLGMLSVRPDLQASGVGKALMNYAEEFARDRYGSAEMEMTVITVRPELLAWYERRGYRRTGQHVPFPVHPRFGLLKVPFLEMEVLQKSI